MLEWLLQLGGSGGERYHPPLQMTLAGIGGLGPWELVIILVIILIVFGAGKLPGIGSSLGEAMKNFKKAVKEDKGSKSGESSKHDGPHQ